MMDFYKDDPEIAWVRTQMHSLEQKAQKLKGQKSPAWKNKDIYKVFRVFRLAIESATNPLITYKKHKKQLEELLDISLPDYSPPNDKNKDDPEIGSPLDYFSLN